MTPPGWRAASRGLPRSTTPIGSGSSEAGQPLPTLSPTPERCLRQLDAPPVAMEALARALGLVVRDVVLTGDEIRGLTAGLLVSHAPALGRTSFIDWLDKIGPTLGRGYLNELERHFGAPRASAHA